MIKKFFQYIINLSKSIYISAKEGVKMNKFPKFSCPFCNSAVALTEETFTEYKITHQNAYIAQQVETAFPKVFTKKYKTISDQNVEPTHFNKLQTPLITVSAYKCPNCEKETYTLISKDNDGNYSNTIPIIPNSFAKNYGEIVPSQIQEDYREAYAILHLSPKASATLSRRCIQGMIRDYWAVTEKTLYQEIESIKPNLNTHQNEAIDVLRKIGNIGAHPDTDINTIIDINPQDAEILIKLIEYFINEWYIARFEHSRLLKEVKTLGESKNL